MSKARPGPARRLLRPVTGWRGFIDELLIVVVGVFLALVAQQWVEDRTLTKRLRFTEAALTLELAQSLYAANERVMIDPCMKGQLSRLHQQLADDPAMWTARPMFAVKPGTDEMPVAYGSPVRLWPTGSWETVTASDTLSVMPADRVNSYSKAYAMVGLIRQQQQREWELGPRIAHLAQNGRLDDEMRAQSIDNVSALYQNNHLMTINSQQLIAMISEFDLRFDEKRAATMNKELSKIRNFFGACALPRTVRL